MSETEDQTYLGIDLSTQQMKGVVVNESLEVLHETSVQFDSILPEFRTHNGVVHQDKAVVTAPVLMWVKALDLLLEKLRVCGANFSQVAALSGSSQQHGTVYWQCGAQNTLRSLDPDSFLHTELSSAFALKNSPVWLDSSTSHQCHLLEQAVGGSQKMAELTGSKAYERFSAAQIMKIAQTKPSAYLNTERISLVSSFLCSLFLSQYAPIDWSDGSGMNLLDITTKQWSSTCLHACADGLESRLGEPVPSNTNLGPISNYMVERYGFDPSCQVIAFTGDNPSSLAGMGLRPGDMAVSLGTSDTLFLSLAKPTTLTQGHILVNPVNPDAYMALLCFKNGSLTRERIRNMTVGRSWEQFNTLLNSTPRGNFGNIGLYFDATEIIPIVQGEYRWDKAGNSVSKFTDETEVRAVLEGQFIGKRAHAEDLGFIISPETRILATGGGSNNIHMLQVLADCFNTPVYTLDGCNSAVLGAAYRAKHGLRHDETFADMLSCLPQPKVACKPYADSNQIYKPMVERYRALIQEIQKNA